MSLYALVEKWRDLADDWLVAHEGPVAIARWTALKECSDDLRAALSGCGEEYKCCIKADKLGVRMCPDCDEASAAYSGAMGVGIKPDTLAGKIMNIPIPDRGFHEGWRDEEIWDWALREAATLAEAVQAESIETVGIPAWVLDALRKADELLELEDYYCSDLKAARDYLSELRPLYLHPAGAVQVDEAMVERACDAFTSHDAGDWLRNAMRVALFAALNPGGSRE